MIRFESVRKVYGEREVVRGIDFEVPEGELCVLVGPSGCGKSTTLRMVNRLVEPDAGRVLVDGADVRSRPAEELRRAMGYVIQQVGLFPHRTVAANVETVPRLLGWPAARRSRRTEELLNLVGLDPSIYRDRYPAGLSGGEAQRVGVARALAADPPILLMDEPFGAVDPLNRETLQREFSAIRKRLGKTVIFVTHDLDEAIRMGDRVAVLKDGALVQYDTPERILAAPADRFVREFTGNDRALKRLARFPVRDRMRSAPSCGPEKVLQAGGGPDSAGHFWVVDENKWIKGLLRDISGPLSPGVTAGELMERISPKEIAVREDSSLRDALARMLGQGVRTVPVVDELWRLVGELSFQDVVRIAEEGDYSW